MPEKWYFPSKQYTINYLAHAYLSFNHDEVLTGNLISDFVKGKAQYDYPAGIQQGITLHRAIDTFTDAHPATREAKSFFRPAYRLYAGAFVDVVYDHFLAADEREFSEEALAAFAGRVYDTLGGFTNHFPDRFSRMFPYMKSQNWLFHYRSLWGTEKSFGGVVRRSVHLTESDTAFRIFSEHYADLRACYDQFFPDVKAFAHSEYQRLVF